MVCFYGPYLPHLNFTLENPRELQRFPISQIGFHFQKVGDEKTKMFEIFTSQQKEIGFFS